MHTLPLSSVILAVAMGSLGSYDLNSATVTRIAFDANADEVDLSVKNGPYNDKKIEVIDALNYDDDKFFVRIQKPANIEFTPALLDRIARGTDAFLSEPMGDQRKIKSEQFGTIAMADLGRGIQSWTTLLIERKADGKYGVTDLGPIDIVKAKDDQYGIAYNGFAMVANKVELLEMVNDLHKLANALGKGVELPQGTFLARTKGEYALHATNGFQAWLYDYDLKLVKDDKVEMDDTIDTAGAMILPTIDASGQIVDDQVTAVTGRNHDWDVFTGSKVDFDQRGWKNRTVQRFAA